MQKKYLILGLGISGISAAYFLLKKQENVILVDRIKKNDDEQIKDFISKGAEFYLEDEFLFSNFSNKIEKVIVSPGIPQNNKILKQAKDKNIEVIGEIELGFQSFLKGKCIAITGTNGKTTLTMLITHILNCANKKAAALGNVGNPLTGYLSQNPQNGDFVVLELSSYQLETLKSKKIDVGIIINITPDHMDRYESFSEYKNAKLNIFNCIKDNGSFYSTNEILKDNFFKNSNIKINEIENDITNIAIRVCLDLNIDASIIADAIKTFIRPKHRIEFVNEKNGISFYNDSKATNADSTIYAVNILKKPIILIAGGVDKKLSFDCWNDNFSNYVKKIFAIGDASKNIKKDVKKIDVEILNSLDCAIEKAYSMAKKGDVILLSPGCSSFDMFKNYEHRGEEFKRIVNNILGEKCQEEIQ
ncbi:MAG: UDP-N-acetylmuramoyl-L-alanine--D-glutamate ligase [Parachlamydiales bacterium]|nr:UDP-N-acetylmuramoyl-L-alanine--D-glutamate ligase [Parachlamydiales bacterium]